MKSARVIRHVSFEDLGGFASVLDERGYDCAYLDAGVDDLGGPETEAADLLVVLGGPIGAYQDDLYPFLGDELRLIEGRLTQGRPVLGVCLGAQLIARALGARVYPAVQEIGWTPLQLSEAGLQGPLARLEHQAVLHWHLDTFDLPQGAVRLASTPACPNQAFALGAGVLALQFHPEVTGAGFERWLIGHAGEISAAPGVTVPQLRLEAQQQAKPAEMAGRACLADWLTGLEPTRDRAAGAPAHAL